MGWLSAMSLGLSARGSVRRSVSRSQSMSQLPLRAGSALALPSAAPG